MNNRVRVAAVQFAAGVDVQENLATCLRMIDEAAQVKPELIVMPEFCNHASWYKDADHCYQVAVDLDGEFVAQIGAKAAQHHTYIMLNCTVRRDNGRVTGTNILFDSDGQRIATSDKQVLMGNENNFLSKATEVCPIIETPLGKLGMYSCMDGVIFETPRGLAVRGAQILLNSLNSFADDEASLHVPVRAAENKVFVVAANKVGGLVPDELLTAIAARIKIAPEQLHGAGESQIVAPDGKVLAKAPRTGEAVIYADIDPTLADYKTRPDATHIMQTRRPSLYAPLAQAPQPRQYKPGADSVRVGVYQTRYPWLDGIIDTASAIMNHPDLPLIVLPAMFFDPDMPHWSSSAVDTLTKAVKPGQYVVTTIATETQHIGVIISSEGIIHRQPQLHTSGKYGWATELGDCLIPFDLPFGRVAVIVGEDSVYPEVFRLAALQNVEVALVSTDITEPWEMNTGFLERAAENRMSVIVATCPNRVGSNAIITIDEDFTLWTEWKNRPFDGNINYPVVTRASAIGEMTVGTVYPSRSGNRLVSQKTDVVDGRPYWLLDALVKP